MKNHILHDSTPFTPFKEKSPDHIKDRDRLKLLKNFDVNLTSFLGGDIKFGQ